MFYERLHGRLSKNDALRRHFWIDMRFVAQTCLIWSMLFVTAHRLPALIVEEEKLTPASEKSAQPNHKRPTNSNSNQNSERSTTRKTNLPPQSQSTPNPRPFARTWIEKGKGASGITIDVSPTKIGRSQRTPEAFGVIAAAGRSSRVTRCLGNSWSING